MSVKYKIRDPEALCFLTFSVVGWIDVFTRDRYRQIIVESLNFCVKEKGLVIFSWVLMSNHIHLIAKADHNNLSNVIRDFKRHTSKTILKSIQEDIESRQEWLLYLFGRAGAKNSNNKHFQFWQQDNHPIELYSNIVIDQKLDYIHNNPVVNGLVKAAEDYVYSSAGDYYGIKGLVDVELMDAG